MSSFYNSEREYYPDPEEIYEDRYGSQWNNDPDAFFLDDPRDDDEEDEDEIPFDEDMQ